MKNGELYCQFAIHRLADKDTYSTTIFWTLVPSVVLVCTM